MDLTNYQLSKTTIQDFENQSFVFESQKIEEFYFKKLTYFVAAEINNPLAIINSHIQQMQSSLENQNLSSTDLQQRLDQISHSNFKISRLFRHILRLSEAKPDNAQPEFIFLRELVTDTLELCQSRLLQHQFQTFLAIDLKLIVYVTASEIMQIILDLVDCSLRSNQGREKSWLQIESSKDENFAILRFYDSSVAIDLRDSENAPPALSIAKYLAHKNHGSLHIENDCGTKIILKLPLAK